MIIDKKSLMKTWILVNKKKSLYEAVQRKLFNLDISWIGSSDSELLLTTGDYFVVINNPNPRLYNGANNYCYKVVSMYDKYSPYINGGYAISTKNVNVRKATAAEIDKYREVGKPYDVTGLQAKTAKPIVGKIYKSKDYVGNLIKWLGVYENNPATYNDREEFKCAPLSSWSSKSVEELVLNLEEASEADCKWLERCIAAGKIVPEVEPQCDSNLIVGETYEIFDAGDNLIRDSKAYIGHKVVLTGFIGPSRVTVNFTDGPKHRDWGVSPTCLRKPTTQSTPAPTPSNAVDEKYYYFKASNQAETEVMQRLLFSQGFEWGSSGKAVQSFLNIYWHVNSRTIYSGITSSKNIEDMTCDPSLVKELKRAFLELAKSKGFVEGCIYETLDGYKYAATHNPQIVGGYNIDCGLGYIYHSGKWSKVVTEEVITGPGIREQIKTPDPYRYVDRLIPIILGTAGEMKSESIIDIMNRYKTTGYLYGVDLYNNNPCNEIDLPKQTELTLQSLPKLNI